MTLDEAIKHCEEKAKELSNKAYEQWGINMTEEQAYACNECAREHEQLAKWLKELAKVKDIVEHWNDKNSSFVSATIAFEKILDVFGLEVNNEQQDRSKTH